MTTTHPQTTEQTGPTWDPPCVACGNPIGVEMPDGKYIGRTKCDACSGVADLQRLVSAGIPRWFIESKASLATFDTRNNASLRRALEKANAMLKPLDLFDRTWLVLTGESGAGKSHIAAAIAQEFLRQGRSARFVTFDDILVEIQDSYNAQDDDAESTGRVIDRYTRGAHFLAIDDIGVEQPTAHAIQILYRILNARLNDRLPTVMTTNYPLAKKHALQPTLGDRLSGKLTDDTPVRRILDRIAGEARHEHIDAPSYRRLKK